MSMCIPARQGFRLILELVISFSVFSIVPPVFVQTSGADFAACTARLKQGEGLETWSQRLGSQWGPVFSAAMNGLAEEGHEGRGELLKYARKEQYRTK